MKLSFHQKLQIFFLASILIWSLEYPAAGIIHSWIPIAVSLFLLEAVIYQCYLYPEFFTPYKALPTIPGRSFWFGSVTDLTSVSKVLFDTITNCPKPHLLRAYLPLNFEVLVVGKHVLMHEIDLHRRKDFAFPPSLHNALHRLIGGGGIFRARGEEHKRQRVLFSTTISSARLGLCRPGMWRACRDLINSAGDNGTLENPVYCDKWLRPLVLEALGYTFLGQPSGWAQSYPDIGSTMHRCTLRADMPHAALDLVPQPFRSLAALITGTKQHASSVPYLRGIGRDMIERRKCAKFNIQDTRSADAIASLLEAGTYSEDEIIEHVLTFLGAGFDTTISAIQWGIICLCKYPAVQVKLRKELRLCLPTSENTEDDPDLAGIDKLTYLAAFCNEVLRLHPSIPITYRQAIQDTTLAGLPVTKGKIVVICIRAFLRDPEVWGDEAGEFNPERWLRDDLTTEQRGAFMPFGLGPTTCAGRHLATMEFKYTLAALVSHFHMELEDPDRPIEPRNTFTAGPEGDVLIRLKKVVDPGVRTG